jgi:hypothetical protein
MSKASQIGSNDDMEAFKAMGDAPLRDFVDTVFAYTYQNDSIKRQQRPWAPGHGPEPKLYDDTSCSNNVRYSMDVPEAAA